MDRQKFFTLSRRYHVIDNPISEAKLDSVIDALHLPPGARVLDIACGKGEMLCRIAARYGANCTGVEQNTAHCADGETRAGERGLSGLVDIHCMPGQDFDAPSGSFDVAMCIGAEWIFGGLTGTLTTLARWARKEGTVVVGTPFWRSQPSDAYLSATGLSADQFLSHAGNVAAGENLGLRLAYVAVSTTEEWDHYSALTWLAAYDYIRGHPGDPDDAEIAELTAADKRGHFGGGRDYLGWAIYVFYK